MTTPSAAFKFSLREIIGYLLFALIGVLILQGTQKVLFDRLARNGAEAVRAVHPQITRSYPEVRGFLEGNTTLSSLTLVPPTQEERRGLLSSPAMSSALRAIEQGADFQIVAEGLNAAIVVPWSGTVPAKAAVYTLDSRELKAILGSIAIVWVGLLLGLIRMRGRAFRELARRAGISRWVRRSQIQGGRIWRLRAKFVAAIVAVNLITASIIFFTISGLQTREQTGRIERQALIFSQFTTSRAVLSFVRGFQSSYLERFLPEIREIIASNEDLVRIRIVSAKSRHVLFDSERALSGDGSRREQGPDALHLSADAEMELQSRDLMARKIERDGAPFFTVIQSYRGENAAEPLFLVEYLYSYRTLDRNISAIRRQILLDLIPSLAVGLGVALLFAQFLISPIRKLVQAFGRVSSGNYQTRVTARSRDELGDLISAFNSMTDELQRKTELRKYLSNSSYQRIMHASQTDGGLKIGGARVAAVILFCDIRDFVSHCESLEAEEVTSMLNSYFSEMVEVIHKNGGEVDKFIGDAILAVFYDDASGESSSSNGAEPQTPALRAIFCAFEMKSRLAQFNARRISLGKRKLENGIGINFGEIISGPIGAENRMDFTVIGDPVNVASRIEKLSKKGKHTRIVFSAQIEERVRGLLDYEELEADAIRGKQEEVRVFELIGIKDLHFLVRNLKGDDIALRKRSVELLGQSRNRQAVAAVLGSLSDSDPGVRLTAAKALETLTGDEDRSGVVDAVLDRLSAEKDPKVIASLLNCAGRIGRDERVLEIARFLDSSDERIVANTVEALGRIKSPKVTDLVLPQLHSRNNRIKANAAMAIFAAGHLEVIEMLKAMLMHSDPLMRSSAAFALGELTLLADRDEIVRGLQGGSEKVRVFLAELQQSVPMLVSLLKDPDARVKRQSVIALGKIKDRSALLPMIGVMDTDPGLARDLLEALRTIGSHQLIRDVASKL